MLSSTVTIAVHTAVLPLASVTVSVTVLAPKSAAVKEVISADKVNVQLSEEPLSRSAATILALPVASN